MKFKIKANEIGITNSDQRFHKACLRATGQVMELGEQEVKKESPSKVAAGKQGGRGSITYTVTDRNGNIVGTLSAIARARRTGVNYLYFITKGTGIYGPRKRPIVAKNADFLAFMKDGSELPATDAGWRAAIMSGKVVFRRKVKGQKPNDFIVRGMERAFDKGPGIFNREIEKMDRFVS